MGRRSRAPRQPPSAEAEADAPYGYGYATREACVKASSRPPGASVARDAPDHRERATRDQVAGLETASNEWHRVQSCERGLRAPRTPERGSLSLGSVRWARGSPPARTTALSLRRSPRYPVILLSSPRSTRRDARKWRELRTLSRRDAGMRRPIPSRLPSRFAIMRPISRAKSHPDEATHERCEPRPHRPGQSHYMQRWSASAQPEPLCQTSLKSPHPRGIGEPARIMGRRPYVRPTMPEQWSRDGVRPPPESSHAHTAGLQAPNRAANNARAGTPEPSARSAASWRGFRRRAREAVGRRRPRSATRFGQSCHAYRRWMS